MMMFKLNETKEEQISLFSPRSTWNNFQKRRIEKSWAKEFSEVIFPNIDEKAFKALYSSDKASRPNIPVNVVVGLLIIKELENLTDEEVMDALMFDERVQYALKVIDNEEKFGSENTLNHFRRRLNSYYVKTGIDLIENEMKKINEILLEATNITSQLKRIDSLMISSSCRNLNRIELVYEVNKNIIKKMQSLNMNIKDFKHYLDEGKKDEILYKTKSTEENNKLAKLLSDSVRIYNRIKLDKKINETKEFKQLERLINDQYDKENKKPKNNKDIKPTSMQTPYDEEATYRFKYGNNVGYIANVEETVEIDKKMQPKKVMISNWSVDKNIKSDKEYMKEFISENENVVAIVDSAYYSEELNNLAKEKNIEIHPTELVGKKVKDDLLYKFKINEETKEVLECPNKEKPIRSLCDNNGIITATFDLEKCKNCPYKEKCATKILKRSRTLKTKIRSYKRSKQATKYNEDNYIKISNIRAGVEGIPSVLRRRYNIDTRGGKGFLRLKIKFACSIISINIKRMVKIRKDEIRMA